MRPTLALAFLFAGTSLFGANIVVNPGFEAGGAGWTTNWFIGEARGGNPVGPNEAGTGCVGSGCIDSSSAFLYQDLTTVIGQTYTISFNLYSDSGTPSQVRVLWGGANVLDIVDPTSLVWTPFSVNVVATATTTRLQFNGRHDPAGIFLDDISADDASVPEPTSMILAATGIAALALGRWRRQQ